ncbi:MAG TPA: hypothetical protein VIY29_27720, partial [Ktedonobacteraceae bacterium]
PHTLTKTEIIEKHWYEFLQHVKDRLPYTEVYVGEYPVDAKVMMYGYEWSFWNWYVNNKMEPTQPTETQPSKIGENA